MEDEAVLLPTARGVVWRWRCDDQSPASSVSRDGQRDASSARWRGAAPARGSRHDASEAAGGAKSGLDDVRTGCGADGVARLQRFALDGAPRAASHGLHAEKKSLVAKERETERIQQWREHYTQVVGGIAASRLVFVDETGTHVAMTRETAWSLCGTRAVGVVPRQRGTTLTVVGAIALDGVRAMMAYEGGTNREAFLQFVRESLVPSLRPGDVVVWDNLGAHRAAGVRDAVHAAGASVVWLPPYHPELNPIELAWTKLKRLLRKAEARTYQELAVVLKQATTLITPNDTEGWLRHCGHHQVI